MDKIRVYEAAKKLNIKTKELINLLLGKGIAVKSPISFISQQDFESLLNSMTDTGKAGKAKPAKSKKKKRAVKTASAPKQKDSKLSLVPPLPSDKAESPKDKKVDSKPEPEKKISKKAEPAKKIHKLPKKHEPVKPAATAPIAPLAEPAKKIHKLPKKHESVKPAATAPIAPLAAPAKPRSSLLAYLSTGMAAMALLVALALSFNVSDNTSGLGKMSGAVDALKAELAGVNDGIRINQDLIFENRDSIANVQRTEARIGLSKHSAALEELALSLPSKLSERVLNISKGMNSLASSL